MINNSEQSDENDDINLNLYIWTIVHPGVIVSFVGLVIFFISLDISETNFMTVVGIILIVTGASMVTLCPRPCERPAETAESVVDETVTSQSRTSSHRESSLITSPARSVTPIPSRSRPDTPRRAPSRMSSLVVIIPSGRSSADAPPHYSIATSTPHSPQPPEYDSPPSYEEALRLAMVKIVNE